MVILLKRAQISPLSDARRDDRADHRIGLLRLVKVLGVDRRRGRKYSSATPGTRRLA
jgi:hypothetical protein